MLGAEFVPLCCEVWQKARDGVSNADDDDGDDDVYVE